MDQPGEPEQPQHTCLSCCQALGYLDSCMAMDVERYRELTWWWKLRHPWATRYIRIRADYALDLLDEAGK